jgi:hypothetical protein
VATNAEESIVLKKYLIRRHGQVVGDALSRWIVSHSDEKRIIIPATRCHKILACDKPIPNLKGIEKDFAEFGGPKLGKTTCRPAFFRRHQIQPESRRL